MNSSWINDYESLNELKEDFGDNADDENNIKCIIDVIREYRASIKKVELIKGHNLGDNKYVSLGKEVPQKAEVSDQFLEEYRKKITEVVAGVGVEICKL